MDGNVRENVQSPSDQSPEEEQRQRPDEAPERILQIDDPKAVHIDGERWCLDR